MNVINQFIAGLNDNQKKLLVIAVVMVIVALFDRLLIGPTVARLSSLNEDIAKQEAVIKQDMHFLEYKGRIDQETGEIAPYLTAHRLGDNETIAAFLNKIQGLATAAQVNLLKINPSSGQQDARYWKYQADLECTGSLSNVVSFMHAVNSDPELMKVDKFEFTGKKDSADIRATMTIEKIVVPSKSMPPKEANASSAASPATP
ncbi:MAG: type 4a pilus biogenesis protein PilO [Candidatus Omnitrophica bacterium]|nr:type 4a pilus biogenesis protein PilO [Candidatus Omnitrophota bacterium]MDE2214109.1 type 4a pilus biogenesis protein PilO [Candidatus Omnitrophota bacterium]MDE2231146.1 type 4a pilus biogenesis protein PilO [Candidatus Omnitrophota bacterium]